MKHRSSHLNKLFYNTGHIQYNVEYSGGICVTFDVYVETVWEGSNDCLRLSHFLLLKASLRIKALGSR